MAAMILCLLLSFVAAVFGGVVPSHSSNAVNLQGFDHVDYSHLAHYSPSLPAYSTVSYVMSSGHSHPVSYSGFTNHGRGHHDPGYAVQYRSEGFPSHGGYASQGGYASHGSQHYY